MQRQGDHDVDPRHVRGPLPGAALSVAGAQQGFAVELARAAGRVELHGRLHLAAWELDTGHSALLVRGDEAVPAASTIKVAILAAALREVAAGQLELERKLAIPDRRAGGSGVLHAMMGTPALTLADLLTLMVIVSDNTATNVVIDALGIDRVNRLCHELALPGTALRRRMMDTDAADRGLENTTTALDQARLLEALDGPALLAEPLRTFALRVLAAQQFNDGLPALLPEGAQTAHKTGELPGIRHDVGILTAASGRRAVVSVLITSPDEAPAATPASDSIDPGWAPAARASAGTAIAEIGRAAWQALHV